MSMLGEYILGRLSRDPAGGDYLNEGFESKHNDPSFCISELQRWFPDITRQIAGKKVLDIGCGEGMEALALSRMGAAFVHGIDIYIDAPRNEAIRKESAGEIRFSVMDATHTSFPDEEFDAAVTYAAFEHFADPFAVLKECVRVVRPGGLVFLTSSVWAHPYGSHMQFFTKVPWVQYLFSEKTIMTVRKKYRNDGAMRFADVPGGLNKVGIASFRRMVKALDLELPYLKLNAIKQLDVLTKIPYVNELFTNMFIAVIRKRPVPHLMGH
jgi:SAM-dependent methyltransferase